VGLLGILLGEQIPPLIKSVIKPDAVATSWLRHQVKPHVFGELPQCAKAETGTAAGKKDT
jgi:xanthosine utilization system XapX-like protein